MPDAVLHDYVNVKGLAKRLHSCYLYLAKWSPAAYGQRPKHDLALCVVFIISIIFISISGPRGGVAA